MQEISNYAERDVEILLIGNKCDLLEKKIVETEKVKVNKIYKF